MIITYLCIKVNKFKIFFMKNVADFEKEFCCLMLFQNVKNIAEIVIALNNQI